jgi:hypothetical protein
MHAHGAGFPTSYRAVERTPVEVVSAMRILRSVAFLLGVLAACAAPERRAPAVAPPAVAPSTDASLPTEFSDAVAEARLAYAPPAGFHPVAVRENPDVLYTHALLSPSGNVEVRYRIDPIRPNPPCPAGMTCTQVDPNKSAPQWFMVVTANIGTVGMDFQGKLIPVDEARQYYGADWAAIGSTPPRATFATGYDHALVLMLHRDDVANVTVIVLMKKHPATEQEAQAALASLHF